MESVARNSLDHHIRIRAIEDSDSISDLTELLDRAYASLADMGFNYTAYDQSAAVTRWRIEAGDCFVADIEGLIVGTVTFYKPDRRMKCHWYKRPDTAHFGQFAVEPALQGKGIGSRLLTYLEEIARTLGFCELALDTAEGATKLFGFYLARRYRLVDQIRWPGKSYDSLVMSKALGGQPGVTEMRFSR